MVELKQMTIDNTNALGIIVNLPRGELRFIVRNHIVICDESINLEVMVKKYPYLCILQVKDCTTLEEMLDGIVMNCSKEAIELGVYKGMKSIDVFALL